MNEHNDFKEEALYLIREVEENPALNQRFLSQRLNISLGKTNYLLKELIKKGFIKKKIGKHANCYELVLNRYHPSVKKTLVGSVKKTHTIDKVTIDNTNNGDIKYPSYEELKKRTSLL